MIETERIIDHYIRRLSSKWEVLLRTDKGIQVKKIKRVNMLGFWVGLGLIPFWGIGFIMWILVILDYALRREKVMFISVGQMTKQLKEAK